MKHKLFEELERRQLFTTFAAAGFTETHIGRIVANVTATMEFTPDGRL